MVILDHDDSFLNQVHALGMDSLLFELHIYVEEPVRFLRFWAVMDAVLDEIKSYEVVPGWSAEMLK